eukprot:504890-Amphidinium_carterae.1
MDTSKLIKDMLVKDMSTRDRSGPLPPSVVNTRTGLYYKVENGEVTGCEVQGMSGLHSTGRNTTATGAMCED